MKVLLLDEPAAGMNPTETAELVECISIVRERFGIAILLIEHDMSLVLSLIHIYQRARLNIVQDSTSCRRYYRTPDAKKHQTSG